MCKSLHLKHVSDFDSTRFFLALSRRSQVLCDHFNNCWLVLPCFGSHLITSPKYLECRQAQHTLRNDYIFVFFLIDLEERVAWIFCRQSFETRFELLTWSTPWGGKVKNYTEAF